MWKISEVQRRGFGNIYFAVISGSFVDEAREAIRGLKIRTPIREVRSLEANAVIELLENSLRNPKFRLGPSGYQGVGLQDFFVESGILTEADVREADSVERSDPEPLTQQVLIEPLFDALNYPTFSPEAGDLSDQRGQQADYAASLKEYTNIDSNRLLIEAEPINKRLDQSKHGLGQVKDWLEKDKFEANLGMATDGLRWIFIKYDRDTYTHDTIAEVDLQPVVFAAFENHVGPNNATDVWLDDELRSIVEEFVRVFEFENFLSIASDAPTVIKERKQAVTDEFYDEYVQRVFGIGDGEDEPRSRSLIGEGIVAPPEATGDDIRLFAVELMNRLIFVKFLEDKELVG